MSEFQRDEVLEQAEADGAAGEEKVRRQAEFTGDVDELCAENVEHEAGELRSALFGEFGDFMSNVGDLNVEMFEEICVSVLYMREVDES